MINVSDAFKQKLQDGEKVWQEVGITFPDGTVKTVKDEIMGENCTYSDCAESSSFPIGTTICKSMTLELDNSSDQWKDYCFYMAKVHAYIKMQIDSETVETIDKGTYTITTPEQYGELLSFTALDNMYKANATYTSKLVLPQTIINLVRDACDTLNIPFDGTMQHGNLIVSELPENMTFRQLFGWAAMLETANARLDNKGYLQFIKWDFSNLQEDYSAVVDADGNVRFKGGASIDSENFVSPTGNWTIDNDGFLTLIESAADTSEKLKDFFESPTVSSDDIVITGIKLKNKENESMYGNTGYVLELENDLVSDADLGTTAAQIGDSIIGVKFRSMLGELAYNPLIEFGDMAYTYDRKWNRYITPLTDVSCSVNGKTTVKTQADDPIRGQSKFQSESTKAIVEARRLVKKEKSAREKAVEKLEETLKNSSGLYETSVPQEDGSVITYLHDKPTLAESKNVIKFTAEAIGVSNDGGKTYPYGFFLTGDLIAKILYAHGINADYIDTGALTIKDEKGNIIFKVDMDTNTVYMNPDILTIGNMTLSKKLKSMDENIASVKNMTFQLSNDMQTITSDADGNIPVFPTVATTAKVMYGSSDITSDCSYTVTKSDSVTGSWDADTHTYTVTALTSDNGWVDIKAAYLQALSITRRFSVSKQKAGASGRTYMIEPSCNVLKRSADNTISPNFVEFKAYYRDGNSATRTAYKGRFVVEETVDGNTWKTIYTSTEDEDTVKHYLYTILTNMSNEILTSSNGSTVGIPRDVVNVRCKLYASGGTTTLMDMQSVAVVVDVDALTQEDILNFLTNNGQWKGIYKGTDGELYISFSAAMGGLLKLGGKNNGNGILKNYDKNGNLVVSLENRGLLYGDDLNNKELKFINPNKNGLRLSEWDGDILSYLDIGIYWYESDSYYVTEIMAESQIEFYLANGIDSKTNPYTPIVSDYYYTTIYNSFRCYKGEATLDNLTVNGVAEFKKNDDIEMHKPVLLREGCSVYKYPTVTTGYNAYINTNTYQISKFSSSSERYKVLGSELSNEFVENLYGICPRMAKYKDGYIDENDERNGIEFPMFIAEDVEKYFPLAVDHTDGKTENWNERIMIPAMFAMLKQQKSEIDLLKQELSEIKQLLRKE